jgi:hypothetical protein
MQVRRSWVAITIIALAVVSATAFVLTRKDRDSESTPVSVATQSPGKESSAPPKLPSNPDGLEFERTVVVDRPFSATLITESHQRMPDGSVSTKTTTSLIYRDEKGRTRRDWLAEPVSATEVESAAVRRSVINDPLSGFTHQLDHRANVAQRTGFTGVPPQSASAAQAASTQAPSRNQVLPLSSSSNAGTNLQTGRSTASSGQTPEVIGVRDIEGVLAEGTRFRFTLPAKADNEQSVEIVTERWYADSIQAVVLVKRTDSRAGETIYRLTNIKRADPAKALFIVPDDYKVTNEFGREVPATRKTARN